MIELIFPDGSKRAFNEGASGRDVASSIAKSLEKRALLVRLDGQLLDLDRPLPGGGTFEILTRESPDALEVIRHDASHVLAQAVQELFPGTQVTIGPAIEDGFYYDFARDEPFSLDDLATIEARMAEIVDRDEKIVREVWDRHEAIAHFKGIGEAYKAEIISDLPKDEVITVYRQGDWKDLCLGPHLPSTRHVGKAFKLTKLAGAYWRGDHRNAQLQRIYGTAWASEADLEAHLKRIEEAERRDHRRIGRAMDLFHLQEEARGMIFWHPKGWTLYRTVESYMRRRVEADGYVEVKAPQIMDRGLWEKSGHWEKFGQAMFTCETTEGEELAVKPMNCPGHVQIFNFGQKSYRDLPLRMAEFGACHRYEPSGALHGIMRLRAFTQDDAHIFCREDQIEAETTKFVKLLNSVYSDFGLDLHSVKLALRPDIRAGSDEVWDIAEAKLDRAARQAVNMEVEPLPGEGAFYGPKLEFHLRDAIGRTWQCGTLQLDFVLPERLDAEYVAEDGSKQRPVMLHRAICGSMERFLGVAIENYAGAFPLWLAPTQAVVASITSDADDYAREVAATLRAAGLRVELDLRNEKINYKVREHSLAKTPVIAAVGRREAETRALAIRRLGSEGQTVLPLDEAVAGLAAEAVPPDLARAALRG
ncbi:threonine--tRNA ligase [Phenylobacterium sp.]|uniref:threonine--tRNA ligase n=1 Tax=Phenylobacterium sp. TaxID=1871053 RepID=UPI0025D33053|nr:threonine--tRNA ligase [Phenylobacterium sp.]MCA6286717.1 threonine--tRNA ligase [Phenylobacterium sp.]MCA6310601.1 threonine--tRNA ligase [Phenylobacterium sp.]MCA6324241.1 threonine--tRNA ligase [Phenylobacterium sp.]MCA6337842.1 threonine--tRNA ligase [Phenylobacterium sp.]MCA6340359.1 threonine--tRNA ligase [Phenylobacterium sp.]